MNRANLFASLSTALFALALLVAPAAGAGGPVCVYPPTGQGAPAAPPTGTSPGPWGTTYVFPDPKCPTSASFTNVSPSCLGPAPYTGEFCGPVTSSGVSTSTGLPWTCTVYPNPTVSLRGMVAAWDVIGPAGVPDGVVDGMDQAVTGPTEGSLQLAPGPGGSFTTILYAPPMPAGYAQIIVFPLATSVVPLLSLDIQVGCT